MQDSRGEGGEKETEAGRGHSIATVSLAPCIILSPGPLTLEGLSVARPSHATCTRRARTYLPAHAGAVRHGSTMRCDAPSVLRSGPLSTTQGKSLTGTVTVRRDVLRAAKP
jgi:hypothetical protein